MAARVAGIVVVIALLAAGSPAVAAPAGSTLWVGVPSGTGFTQGVSSSAFSTRGSDTYDHVGASDDGRYVAFSSQADGLSSEDDDRFSAVYVRDRVSGTTTLVSRASGAAGAVGNSDALEPSISDDGRYVAFTSYATNLDPADLDVFGDVYVRDTATQTTTLVSRATGVAGVKGNSNAGSARISGDGSAVAFQTSANNLAAGDPDAGLDVYRRTLGTSSTALVSLTGAATKGNGDSTEPTISDNGAFVAFLSRATNLDAADADPDTSAYRRNVSGASTVLLDRADGPAGAKADDFAEGLELSGSGDVAVFATRATNIDDAGDPDPAADFDYDIYTRKVSTTDTTLISRVSGDAGAKADDRSYFPSINDSGTRVAFISEADNLGVATTDERPIFVRDTGASPDTTTIASTPPGDVAGTFGGHSALAGEGPGLVYAALGPNLPLSGDEIFQVYGRSPGPDPPELLSRADGPLPDTSSLLLSARFDDESARVLSADGRYVAFVSLSPVFGPSPVSQVLRRDLLTGETVIVSRAPGPAGAPADFGADTPVISADGNRVLFRSDATNLHPDDAVADSDLFVRDIATGAVLLASRADGSGGPSPVAGVQRGRLAPGGGHVVFEATATTLVSGDTNAKRDVFVRDLAAGTTVLASRGDGPAGVLGNGDSRSADISADGTVVAFQTAASNFGDGDATPAADVFVRDLGAGTTRLVSRATGVAGPRAGGEAPVLSADGRKVAFSSASVTLGFDGFTRQVVVRDRTAGTTTLVSRADGEGPAADSGVAPSSISADGDVITFVSDATNLGTAPGPSDRFAWARRVSAAQTILVNRRDGAAGTPLTGRWDASSVSGDGECVAFAGPGEAPFPGASPDFEHVLLRVLSGSCPKPVPAPPGAPPAAPIAAAAPVVSGLTVSPSRFRVGKGRTATSAAARRRKAPEGTTIRLRSTRPGTLRIVIARAGAGRRVGAACRKPTRALRRRKACTRFTDVGRLTRARIAAGATAVRFTGRIGTKALKPGRHRITVTVTDASGARSAPRSATFTVVAR